MKSLKLGILSTVNIILSFFINWYIVFFKGIDSGIDAFSSSNTLPLYLLIFSTALSTVLIPILSKYSDEKFVKEVWNYLHLNLYFFGALTLILFLTAQYWVRLILPGFSGHQLELAIDFTRIQIFAMFFLSFISILSIANTLKHKFYWIEWSSIFANIISLIFVIISAKKMGIYAIAWAIALRSILQFIFLLPVAGKYSKPDFNMLDLKTIKKNILPLLGGSAYYKTDILIDRFFISSSALGVMTILTMSQQFYAVGNTIFSKVLINPSIPVLAKFANEKKWSSFFEYFKRRNLILLIIAFSIAIFVSVTGIFIYKYPFSILSFSHEYIKQLWFVSVLLTGYWIGGLVGTFTANSFYVRGDVKTPTYISVINFTVFIVYKIIMYRYFGYTGLILSISIYYMLSILLHYIYINKFKNTCNSLIQK